MLLRGHLRVPARARRSGRGWGPLGHPRAATPSRSVMWAGWQSRVAGPNDRLGPGRGTDLGQDAGDVVSDGLRAQYVVVGYLRIRKPPATMARMSCSRGLSWGSTVVADARPPVTRWRVIRSTTEPSNSPSPPATVRMAWAMSAGDADFSR